MKFFRTFILNSVFVLNVLLFFLLFFRSELDIPAWLQVAGRMHPLVVHLPIGFLVLAAAMTLFRKGFKKKSFHNFLNFVLYLSAFVAAITAVMGLLLSAEGGYDETQLYRHMVAGVTVSILASCLLLVSLYWSNETRFFNILLVISTIALLAAGHFGSVLTHGENFVLQPLSREENTPQIITDSTSLYAAAVHPVLKNKCMGCHNDKKAKGGLIMSTAEKISKGGKHGPIWTAGDPGNSKLIKRIHLPENNDDHMPPAGKPQLTKSEMRLLYYWILDGADFSKPWTGFNPKDSLRLLAEGFMQRQQVSAVAHYQFPFVSTQTLQELNSPFCSVSQFASDEPALKANFFLPQGFDSRKLEALLKVKEQLVILNLARMPLTEGDGKIISQFRNLEKLNLNNVGSASAILTYLKGLKNLKSLSLTGTKVGRTSLEAITGLASLKEVFLWNTQVTEKDIGSLQRQFPRVDWEAGYQSEEILKLTPPLLVNDDLLLGEQEAVQLKHNLPGSQIRYTLNGADPDSLISKIYQGPIQLSGYTIVKARAFKDGWYGSPVAQFYFFKKGRIPVTAELINSPDKDYKGEGAITLVNNKKGSADNFKDIAWLGYREKPMIALFHVESASPVQRVTVSFGKNSSSFILPPASIELWSGDDPARLKLVQRTTPVQAKEKEPVRIEAIVFSLTSSTAKYYKIIAQPVPRVPVFISKKPEKGWFFVDEVIFD